VSVEVTPVEAEQLAVPLSHAESGSSSTSRRPGPRRALLTFGITALAVALFAVAFVLAFDALNAGKVLPGVEVAGVPVGGLDKAQAEAAIREALPDPAAGSLRVEFDGETASIPFASVDRDYDIESMLAIAFAAGRGGSIIDELRTLNHSSQVEPLIAWNSDALMRAIQSVATDAEYEPVDATIARDGAQYVVVPASEGRALDEQSAYSAAVSALADPAATSASISAATSTIAPQVSTESAQAVVDQIESMAGSDLTLAADGKSITIPSEVLRGWIRLTGSNGNWATSIEQAPIAQYVADLKFQVDVAPTNASFSFKGPGTASVVPSVAGQEIDAESAVSAVVSALEARGSGTPSSTVNLAVAPVAPEFGDAQAAQIVTRVRRLGRWTTHFTVSEFNGGGQNIRRPARLINGTVVEPGATFDFIDAAGPFTKRNGYTDGAAIIHGNTKPDGIVGGGLCSASTTLFNAVLRAGFQIDERHNHAFYITRYPVGLDATIWENGRTRKSMQFTNDTDYPILIKAAYEHGAVSFSVYGVPDGRKVKFSKPIVKEPQEARNYVIYTNDLPPGKFEQKEFRSPGFRSSVTRTVRDAAGNIIHEDTFNSDYRNVNGIYMVGRFPGDPRPGTRILASEYVRPGTAETN